MTIETSTFGGWTLSGEDARAFLEQIENSKPNPLAKAAMKRGDEIYKKWKETGCLYFSTKDDKLPK